MDAKSSSSSMRALVLTLVTFLCFLYYGHCNFYADPGSIFFNPDRALERRYSLHRETETILFRDSALSLQKSYPNRAPKARSDATICGVIITVKRTSKDPIQPLEVAISSALAGMTKAEREDFDLRVYFADTNPRDHPLYGSPTVALADRSGSAQDIATSAQFQELTDLESDQDFSRKVSFDFSYALQYAYNSSNAPYIAIFEGDVIFADGWFARSRMGLLDIDRRTNSARDTWLDMRLFNQERSIGWASRHVLGNNVPFIILGICLGTMVFLRVIRHYSAIGRRVVTKSFLLVICGITIPLLVIFFFQAGKSSMLPPLPGVQQQQWGCCTKGLIMPREQVLGLADELIEQARTPPDVVIEDFAKTKGFLRFALNPVQVQHLGYKSKLDPQRRVQDMPWSMAFEQLRPVKLEKDHKKMVKALYGFDMDSE